jgi:hypothetical protein
LGMAAKLCWIPTGAPPKKKKDVGYGFKVSHCA